MQRSSNHANTNPEFNELRLVLSITEFLTESGYRVRLEVSNMGQSIDLVATKNRWITAIEAKRKDWGRALQQCRAHVLVADFIVIALAQKSIPTDLSEELIRNGWGLIMLDFSKDSWNWKIQPKKNRKVWKPQRERFAASMKEIAYAT